MTRLLISTVFALILLVASFSAGTAAADDAHSLHDFTVESIELEDLDLSTYRGKAVLLVNTASFCGYTPQYEGLQTLYDSMKDEGLVVLGVPSNDFGGQEPGSEQDVKKFCTVNFNIQFPMTSKMVVNGQEGTADIYNWLAEKMGDASRPKWNFHKYLINAKGEPVAYFGSRVTPTSDTLVSAIRASLQQAENS